jgi:hypothetical protein
LQVFVQNFVQKNAEYPVGYPAQQKEYEC